MRAAAFSISSRPPTPARPSTTPSPWSCWSSFGLLALLRRRSRHASAWKSPTRCSTSPKAFTASSPTRANPSSATSTRRFLGFVTDAWALHPVLQSDGPGSGPQVAHRPTSSSPLAARCSLSSTTTTTASARMASATSSSSWARSGGWHALMLPHRDHLPHGARALAHRPSLRQYLRRRSGDAGLLLADPDWRFR